MKITDILAPEHVLMVDHPPEKAQLLRDLATRAAEALGLDAGQLANALLRREELGSTGLGSGIAMPHARIPGVREPLGMLVLLRTPLAFDAVDEKPVDIVFLLIAPEGEDALKALASISRTLRQPAILAALRHSPTAAAAYDVIRRDGGD